MFAGCVLAWPAPLADGRGRPQGLLKHGGFGPHTPLLSNGVVRKESAGGRQGMEEHVPSDKMTAGGACGAERFCRFVIRVQNGKRRAFKMTWAERHRPERRLPAELMDFAALASGRAKQGR